MRKNIIFLTVLIATTITTFAQIPNNGFENWTSVGSYYNPDSWSCLNGMTASTATFTCERGTPGNPGSYYLKLTSKTVSGMGVMPGIAVSGTFNQTTMQPLSGFAFNQRPANLTGSWQHMIFGSSQGYVDIKLTRWDTPMQMRMPVASAHYVLTGMAMSWANFSIPLAYVDGNNPDSCIITLSASGNTPSNYDYLYVDNLSFTGSVASISNVSEIKPISLYPNPASETITFNLENTNNADLTINIYNILGALVKSETLNQNNRLINIRDLNTGTYTIEIKSKDWSVRQKLIIQK